jgi:hypothetical protein
MISTRSQHRLIYHCIKHLQAGFQYVYGDRQSSYTEALADAAMLTLGTIVLGDAAYHNLEHTVIVTLVGHHILCGRHVCEESVSRRDWVNFIVSLLCHDIGYIKGACQGDNIADHAFVTGIDNNKAILSPQATGASLTPYHVDRGKLFAIENFGTHPVIDSEAIQLNIELTRFPIPKDTLHQDTLNYPGLARAADLIGQLSDPGYLTKLPALYSEFEELGGGQAKGYNSPKDLRVSYPKFYWHTVYPYLRHGIRYLENSYEGRPTLASMQDNLRAVEHELMFAVAM